MLMPTPTKRDRNPAELPAPISVEEALRSQTETIRVPDGTERVVGPFDDHSEMFRIAEVTRFKDLHLLGFVPPEITEDEAVRAIRADTLAHRIAVREADARSSGCSCHGGAVAVPALPRRSRFQDHMIGLLQPLQQATLSVDDTTVRHTWRRLEAWLSRPSRYLLGLISLGDIDIGSRATLTMTPTVKALYARNITIAGEGRLHFTGGTIHVRCETLTGPGRFDERSAISRFLPGFSLEQMGQRP